jgi:serine/threonine protein phosphatase 1
MSQTDTLVFLGDYIDRGPHTKQCVDDILRLRQDAPFKVVTLLGNHEEWMLTTMRDHTRHSWLLNIEAFDTIASYSPEAAGTLRAELERNGPALFAAEIHLPYDDFFDQLPDSHSQFCTSLELHYQTEGAICVHAGLDPEVPTLSEQSKRVLTWGCLGFPERYKGMERVVYGHRNYREFDTRGRPKPHILENGTFGIDTLSSGALTAMRFPDGKIYQSPVALH